MQRGGVCVSEARIVPFDTHITILYIVRADDDYYPGRCASCCSISHSSVLNNSQTRLKIIKK